jgi:excisionase family DNA binding protein
LDCHTPAARAVPEAVYTVAEVAALLRLHKSTVYRDVESGRIDAYRAGKGRGTIRIREGAFLDYQKRAVTRPEADAAGAVA